MLCMHEELHDLLADSEADYSVDEIMTPPERPDLQGRDMIGKWAIPERLDGDERKRLFARAGNGDVEARWEVTRMYGRLVMKIALMYAGRNKDLFDHLCSDGISIVFERTLKCDPERDNSFYSYLRKILIPTLRRSAYSYFYGTEKNQLEQVLKVCKKARMPLKDAEMSFDETSPEVIADLAGMKVSTVSTAKRSKAPLSLSVPARGHDEDAMIMDFVKDETGESPYVRLQRDDVSDVVREMREQAGFSVRDRAILRQRYEVDRFNPISFGRLARAIRDPNGEKLYMPFPIL